MVSKGKLIGLAIALLIGSKSVKAQSPNVVFILVDDLGYNDLSCQGAVDIFTPEIDKLAANGIRFTSAYVTAPQCGPSRAGLMTGISQSRFSYFDNSSHFGIPEKELLPTMGEQFQYAGYTTGVIGKWHIGSLEVDDKDITLAGNNPWERGFDYVLTMEGGSSHYFPYSEGGKNWMTSRNREYRLTEKYESSDDVNFLENLPEDTYLTDYFSERAIDFIKRNNDNPWFLFLSYNAPHTPLLAKDEDMEANSGIEDFSRQKFAAMMTAVDRGVGNIVDFLEANGNLSNTLIWFLSDNGGPTSVNTSLNTPYTGYKGHVYEGGIRVPFIVSWPDFILKDTVFDEIITSLDILPTSLAVAGVTDLPEIYEGYNLLDALKGETVYPRNKMFVSWRSERCAVRIDHYKELRNGSTLELLDGTVYPSTGSFDLSINPAELPDMQLSEMEIKEQLSTELNQWLSQVSASQAILTPSPNLLIRDNHLDGFTVYTTSFKNNFRIKPKETDFPYSIKVYDIKGMLIKQKHNIRGDLEINMRNEAGGLYFMHISCNNKYFIKKVICSY